MKKLIISMAVLCALSAVTAGNASAEEELAPGYNKCMEESGYSDLPMIDCISQAADYWDKQLNINYQKARQECSNTDNPQKCQQLLQKAERNWIAFKDNFVAYLNEQAGGSAMGTADRLQIAMFLAQANREQSRNLQYFVVSAQ